MLMDKCSGDVDKAVFYARQTVENGWSRAMLLNFISIGMFERQGKALTILAGHCRQQIAIWLRN